MEEREARIRAETEEARRLRAEAVAEGERYRSLLRGFEAERQAQLSSVQAEAEELRMDGIREARAAIQAQRERWQQALAQEKEAFLRELRLRVGQESVTAMRRALAEMADEALEERLIARFLVRLQELDPPDRD